jgi:hypothetical protein
VCIISGMDSEASPSGNVARPEAATGSAREVASRRDPFALRLARALLVVLAFALPFEVPLFRIGPLQVTSVEIALYAMLAAWAVVVAYDALRGRLTVAGAVLAIRREPMVQAAALWCAVLFASTAQAPSFRAAALKFSLRSLSGILAFFAARSLARSPLVVRRVAAALSAGALLSAATAVVEVAAPGSASLWAPFREGNFTSLGLARASGVFAYPTIGAMYWEAAVPLLVAAPFALRKGVDGERERDTPAAAVAVLASVLLVGAILASATRSGLAGTAIACVGLLLLGRRSGMGVRWAAGGALGVVVVWWIFAAMAMRPGSFLGQRMQWWQDESWFRVEYLVDTDPRTLHAGEVFTVPVTLHNTGAVTWPSTGQQPTHLAYHWQRLDGATTLADYEGLRTELPEDVAPGGVLEVVATARGPAREGRYSLHWDVVQEDVTWFSDRGNAMPDQPVTVLPALPGTPPVPANDLEPPKGAPPPPARSALWRAAVVLWRERPLLGIGPDNFRRRYEGVLSPAPTGQPYTDTRLHANNLYFETLADLGLAGIVALGWIAVALARLLRTHFESGRLLGLALGVAAAAFFVHGALDYFLEFTPLLGLFWVLLGLTAASAPEPQPALAPSAARPDSTR